MAMLLMPSIPLALVLPKIIEASIKFNCGMKGIEPFPAPTEMDHREPPRFVWMPAQNVISTQSMGYDLNGYSI
jgi:hypothetical protein